jgi:ribosomal protein S18 acetylase RimI-like enzyme
MIKPLLAGEYKHHPLPFEYETREYYDVEIVEKREEITCSLVKRAFPESVFKEFKDRLYEDYYENAEAFGHFIGDVLFGVIEINFEKWSNRVRITQLLIDQEHRRKGIGQMLMKYVELHAKKLGARMLILETQSCNVPAIDFYRKNGFKLIGLDVACYGNRDIEQKEVRLEFGKFINQN